MEDPSEGDEAEFDYRTLLENAPDALVMVGTAGEIRFVNSQAEKLFGYRAEELMGQVVDLLVPERYRAIHKKHRATYSLAPKLRRMGAHLSHLAGRRKDGTEFLAEINLSPLPGGLTVVAIRLREPREAVWENERELDRERARERESEREREREHERQQAREREQERAHERAQGRARARKLQSISIPTAIAIVVVAQIVFNLLLYYFFGRP